MVSDMELTQHQRELFAHFSHSQIELLVRLVDTVHAMKYGSVTLTVHDNKVVEIHKTERIRVKE